MQNNERSKFISFPKTITGQLASAFNLVSFVLLLIILLEPDLGLYSLDSFPFLLLIVFEIVTVHLAFLALMIKEHSFAITLGAVPALVFVLYMLYMICENLTQHGLNLQSL